MAQWRTSRGGQYDRDRVRNRPALHERHGRSGARFVRAIPDSCWNFLIGARHSRFVLKFPDSCAPFPIRARDSRLRSWAGCRVGRFATNLNGQITATATGIYIGQADFTSVALGDGSFTRWLRWNAGNPSNFALDDFSLTPSVIFTANPMDFPVDNTYGSQFATPAVALPEPSTYAMALAGLACGGYLVRRSRRAR